MGLFNRKKKTENEISHIGLHLNMRLMPVHRASIFEDPLNGLLRHYNIGQVTGGGTFLNKERMPISCDIEFSIKSDEVADFVGTLHDANTIAKGSYIEYYDDGYKKEAIGTLEGLSLILDRASLGENEGNSFATVLDDINKLIKGKGEYQSFYENEKNTYFYFYGKSFNEMKEIIANYTKTSPLCANSVIEQLC